MQHYFKCVLVGDSQVGKTAFILTYLNRRFPAFQLPPAADLAEFQVGFDGRPISVTLWDTLGADDWARLRPLAYPATDLFVLLYSVVSPASFQRVRTQWLPEILRYCPGARLVLVASKLDLRGRMETVDEMRRRGEEPISREEGLRLAKEINAGAFLECSSVDNVGVQEAMDEAVRVWLGIRSIEVEANVERKRCSIQ